MRGPRRWTTYPVGHREPRHIEHNILNRQGGHSGAFTGTYRGIHGRFQHHTGRLDDENRVPLQGLLRVVALPMQAHADETYRPPGVVDSVPVS